MSSLNDSITTSAVSSAHTHQLLFSDIDGTCVHYENKGAPFKTLGDALAERCIDGLRSDILRLPPSSSGSRGVISRKTLRMYAAVRALGMKLVLISGCRMSTLLERLPYLPKADAYVCESGGRIFYPVDTNSLTTAPLEEDLTWRELHAAAGPPGQDGLPPHERKGILWDYYRDLIAKGTERLDSRSYTTAFRIKIRVNLSDLPSDLATASNLGVIDVFPKTSGKKNAAMYLMNRFNSSPQNSLFMCDDDNDIELANVVKRAYIPTITSTSMREQVQQHPERFVVAKEEAMWATEEILTTILASILGINIVSTHNNTTW